MEVKNIFMTNSYSMQGNKKVPVILNWLGRERLQFIQIFNDEEQEKCKTGKGLFKVLSEK